MKFVIISLHVNQVHASDQEGEGIENEQQLASLTNKAVDELQGYYLSYPLSAKACTQLLIQFNSNQPESV